MTEEEIIIKKLRDDSYIKGGFDSSIEDIEDALAKTITALSRVITLLPPEQQKKVMEDL